MQYGFSDDFVDESEIARRLRVTVAAVRRWQDSTVGFPSPINPQLLGEAWHWSEIEAWARATGRWRDDPVIDLRPPRARPRPRSGSLEDRERD